MNPLGISINPGNVELIPAYAAAGFQVMEISLPAKEEAELRAFGARATRLAQEAGLTLWSVHIPFGRHLDISNPDESARQAALEGVAPAVAMAREWGAQLMVIHGSSEPNEDISRPARMQACARSLLEIQSWAPDIRLALENLPRTCIARVSEETVALAENCAGICFDVNHLLMESHEDFLARAAGRIITTHLSDYDGLDEKHWRPGMGVVPWKLVYDRLTRAGYTGPWLFELGLNPQGGQYDPAEVLREWKKASGL